MNRKRDSPEDGEKTEQVEEGGDKSKGWGEGSFCGVGRSDDIN